MVSANPCSRQMLRPLGVRNGKPTKKIENSMPTKSVVHWLGVALPQWRPVFELTPELPI